MFQIQLKTGGKWLNIEKSHNSEEDANRSLTKILNECNDELHQSGGVFQYRMIRHNGDENEYSIVSSARSHGIYGYKKIQGDNWDRQTSIGLHSNLIGD